MPSSVYHELRPAYIGEQNYTVTLRIPGEGSIATWVYAGSLYLGFQLTPSSVTVAIADPIARTLTVTIQGQASPNVYTWIVRRTDDSSELVAAWGIIDVSDPTRNGSMSGGPWVGWEVVQHRIVEAISIDEPHHLGHWAGLCARGARDAAFDIATKLSLKGYSASQINSCDQIPSWNERLAAYYAVTSRTILTNYDTAKVEKWNVMPEIEAQINGKEGVMGCILIGGKAIGPDANSGDVGGVSFGTVRAARRDAEDFDRFSGWNHHHRRHRR